MATRTRSGPYTFAEFLELVSEDQKADLIDGVIHMASPENLEHNDLVFWLGSVLRAFVERRKIGKVTINKVAYRLSDQTAPEPDLAFVRTERLAIRKRGYVDGSPDLAIEVVSPESAERDYEAKRRRYERAGVEEYWIIDPDEQRVVTLVREAGTFVEAPPEAGVLRSRVVPGFAIETASLWQDPLPDALESVRSMLEASR